MVNDKEYVKDLANKLRGGEINHKAALKRLKKRGLVEACVFPAIWGITPWIVYFILWVPLNVILLGQLPAVQFPAIVIYISLILLAIGTFFVIWAGYYRRKRGGLNKNDTVILCKEGPYRIMRHHEGFGMMLWFILLPIILSSHVPFSPLSVAAILLIIVYNYYETCMEEEKLDIPKWGDEYRQYMKEVPRFNFIKGLWNIKKGR